MPTPFPTPTPTQGALLRATVARLEAAGVEAARRSAEWLLEEVTGQKRALLYAFPERPVTAAAIERLNGLVARRVAGEPLQYVVGHTDFFGLRLTVAPGVLIPRPETEELAERALHWLKRHHSPRILDAGTGSGCLALALKDARPDADVHALDISPEALVLARANAARLRLDVAFYESDLLAPVLAGIEGVFDLVVSNPPYIPVAELAELAREVAGHEPHVALLSGDDPLTFYHALARHGERYVRPGGALFAETHEAFGPASARCFAPPAWAKASVLKDATGRDRFVVALRAA